MGIVFALDLATKTGFAYGEPGAIPASGSVRLKSPDEHRQIAFGNLIAFLNEKFDAIRPATVVKEAMLHLQAFLTIGNGEANVRLQAGLHAIVEGMCVRYGIPVIDAADSTIRKHFIGQARMGDRNETKRTVIRRCHLLKLMPTESLDDNRADAIATHDWACATLRGTVPSELHLFEQKGKRR